MQKVTFSDGSETEVELAEESKIDPEKEMILVGFGKHDLPDMLKWQGTDKESDLINAAAKWPPRWRRLAICTQEEVQNMATYGDIVTKALGGK